MKANHYVLLSAVLPALASSASAQTFNVDVANSLHNPQVHLPNFGDYVHYASEDYLGVGWSEGFGTYYIADGFLTGSTTDGLWRSEWLDAIGTEEDIPPHGGSGTVDIIAPGGVPAVLAGQIIANGLPERPGDANDLYLGIYGQPSNNYSEYALWEAPILVNATTTFQYQYQWANAGGTLADGGEVLIGALMGAQFFIASHPDYPTGDIVFSSLSDQEAYTGAGNQSWFTETGTFTLEPGTYYWGFSATGNADVTYITVDGISISPVPEPSGILLSGLASMLMLVRRRRGA